MEVFEYLRKFGYTDEQAYVITGAAPIEGRISRIVDIPNACCTLYLPTEIFERNVFPDESPPARSSKEVWQPPSNRSGAGGGRGTSRPPPWRLARPRQL